MDSIKASRYRTTKEKVYFFLIALVSIAVWVWVGFSVVSDPLSQTSKLEDECILRNPFYENKIVKLNLNAFVQGDYCVAKEDLTLSEQEELASIETYKSKDENIIGNIEQGVSQFNPTNWSTSLFILAFFFFSLFSHLLAMAYIRVNAVKIGPNQFPELYKAVGELALRLGMSKQPDMFILQRDGIMNAFAARLVFRRLLVVYSSLAEALIVEKDIKQLEAILSHELGHHALGHTSIFMWLIEPGLFIPLLGSVYSRAREYSCDRIMKVLTKDNEPCERALLKLASGNLVGTSANVEAYINQRKEEGGFFAWFAELLATHPHLPKRIKAVREFNSQE